MGYKVVVIVGLVFGVLALACAAVALSGINKGFWKDPNNDYPKFGMLKYTVKTIGGTSTCAYGDNCDVFFSLTKDHEALEGGGKGAVAAIALAVVLFLVSVVLGIARLFEKFGGHIGMGAAATGFMGAFLVTAGWAIMIGIWANWWDENNAKSLDGDYALGLGIASTVLGIVSGACFAYGS